MLLYPKKISIEEYHEDFRPQETLFNMPLSVNFCKKCVISNQKPNSQVEYEHTSSTKKEFIKFNDDGICQACEVAELKKKN